MSQPENNAIVATDYLVGMGSIDARMLILVDIDKVMACHRREELAVAV